jgi:hypothetical protein
MLITGWRVIVGHVAKQKPHTMPLLLAPFAWWSAAQIDK